MKICGTVRRPVRSIISWRRSGSRSTRILAMPTTPLAASSRSACTQYGHWPVEYIVTVATSRLQRQPRAAPRGKAALQVVDVLEARLRERSARAAAALAARAVRDDRLARARGDLA